MDEKHHGRGAVEHMLERVMFGSRWLLAPFYLGLTFALIILLIKFFQKFWGFASNVTSTSTDDMVLGLLGLLDLTLLANLILIVIFAGYETFVSKIEVAKDNIASKWDKQPNKPQKKEVKQPNPNDITSKF